MGKYLKPIYDFLSFNNPMTLEEISEKLTELRTQDSSLKIISYSHAIRGTSVLIERTVLTDIEEQQ